MHLDHVGPGRYGIIESSKNSQSDQQPCRCVGIPIGTSVYNDQHRLPNLSAHVIMYHQQRAGWGMVVVE